MSNKGYGYAFLSGLLAGALAGVLLAPKKGEDLRKDIKIRGEEVYEKVASYNYAEGKEKLTNKVADFKQSVAELDKEKVKDISLEKLENLKGKADDLVSSAKKEVKKTKKKFQDTEELDHIEDVNEVIEDDDLFDEL